MQKIARLRWKLIEKKNCNGFNCFLNAFFCVQNERNCMFAINYQRKFYIFVHIVNRENLQCSSKHSNL